VLKWIFERCEGTAKTLDTPIGGLPLADELDLSGLDLDPDDLHTLLSVDVEGWTAEVPLLRQHFAQFGERLPEALRRELDALERGLRE
jgi:phosphoenolpyruvate carboxykinase (GTP)